MLLQSGAWEYIAANWVYLGWGLVFTVCLTAVSVVLGFLLGLPAGIIETYGSGYSRGLVERAGVLVRGTPIVIILVAFYFLFPLTIAAFWAAALGLGIRSAAYQSQIFRGALQSVGDGQMEAARSVGMSKLDAIRRVTVPQALRRSIPGFQNEFTIVLKDTSVAYAIGLGELLTRGTNLYLTEQGNTAVLEIFLAISAVYFVLTMTTNLSLDALGRRFAIPGGEGR
ncbi:ABC transporter permease subunit [Halosegnis rubeus]|jgi:polar amino acid transport system permease protein|uniref:ABC transporter permease subunit n=1 Tax=Halosegnis rubeus TaxID=2212850 RepID=A0A5N5UHQ6_9EURY|nr:amino acid ABC transporter permease [Halosegnis rubeus]KAB7514959.1 ABC transporter permease subunit [Halosegnis rubeus]KAB7518269.1 ABC transporter permease subunit [Halosegnis rubeus]KAB7519152.1 ABC transporter permease subunit [Halosegnis rubeus]